jgi:hypothetical protein
MARLSIGVSADAKGASSEFKALAEDIKKVGTESVGVTEGVARVDAALQKLARAADTPGALAGAVAKARVEVEALRAELDKTPASAEKLKALNAALAQAESAMAKTVQRAAALRKAQGDVNKEIDITSGNVKEAIGQYGSLAGITDKLAGSTSTFVGAIGKAGLVGMAMSEIWKVSAAAGQALAAGIDAISASLDKQAKAEGAAIDRKIQFDKAIRLAKDGTIALGHSTEEMLRNYDAYVEKMRAAAAGTDEQTASLKRQRQAFDELVAGLPDLQKKHTFTLMSPEDAAKQLDSVKALAEGLNNAFEKAFQAGGEGERDKWVAANEEAVKKVTEAYQKAGLELPSHFKAIAQAQDDSAARAMEWATQQAAAYDQVAQAATRRREAEAAAQNFSSPAAAEFKAIQDAAVGAAVANGQFGDSLDKVAGIVAQTGGTMQVGVPILLSLRDATDEATAALYRHLEASRLLREEQTAALGITDGWMNYLANLKESYDTGVTSLNNYISLLADFQRQLQTMFAGASGDAKKQIDDVTDAIRALIATATGSGPIPTLDVSPLGQLERELARKKRGK